MEDGKIAVRTVLELIYRGQSENIANFRSI